MHDTTVKKGILHRLQARLLLKLLSRFYYRQCKLWEKRENCSIEIQIKEQDCALYRK